MERFWDEAWNKKNLAIVDELFSDDVVTHNFGAVVTGRDAWRQSFAPFLTAFPDLKMTVEFTMSEGDKVAVRFMTSGTQTGELRGIPPTGKQISVAGVAIYRVASGKIVEIWSQSDTLGMMQQLGVIPTPG